MIEDDENMTVMKVYKLKVNDVSMTGFNDVYQPVNSNGCTF